MRAQTEVFPEMDGYIRHITELEICDAWQLPSSDGLLEEPICTDLPILVLGGSFDPITPPQWSRTATVNMTNSTFIEVPSAGHSVLSAGPCPVQIVSAFFDNPDVELDLSCLNDVPPSEYVLPKELIIAPSIYEFHWNEIGASQMEENIFLGGVLRVH